MICANCGKRCTTVAERTSCCGYNHVFDVIVAPDSKLTKAQIEAMATKLNANGLGPGARVFDVEAQEWTTAEQWRAKFDDQPKPPQCPSRASDRAE